MVAITEQSNSKYGCRIALSSRLVLSLGCLVLKEIPNATPEFISNKKPNSLPLFNMSMSLRTEFASVSCTDAAGSHVHLYYVGV